LVAGQDWTAGSVRIIADNGWEPCAVDFVGVGVFVANGFCTAHLDGARGLNFSWRRVCWFDLPDFANVEQEVC
jgi:hypothetical protein